MRIAVLGAGISGLSVARLLKDQEMDVTTYERNKCVGGLARTRFPNGYLYDPYGGHIFNSKHPEVVDWVFSIYGKDKWQYTIRNAKIHFNGKLISYPFELSLCELDTEDAVNCLYDYILARQGPEPVNFKDWLMWNFGRSICEDYIMAYNEKVWSYPLEKMETGWMRGKMPLPDKKDLIRSLLLKDPTERKMPHSSFYYPLRGGIQSFMDAAASGLDVRCGCSVERIERANAKWFVNGDGPFDRVVSTIPLPELAGIMDLPQNVADAAADLKFNSLNTVLFTCPKTDVTWLYLPSHRYAAHRVGYQSALTPNAAPNRGEGVAAFEVIGPKIDFDHTPKQAFLPEELGYREKLDSTFTKYAYVIHDLNMRKNLSIINAYFDQLNGFYLHGRWGRWNYNNMDLCIWDSMRLAEKLSACGGRISQVGLTG